MSALVFPGKSIRGPVFQISSRCNKPGGKIEARGKRQINHTLREPPLQSIATSLCSSSLSQLSLTVSIAQDKFTFECSMPPLQHCQHCQSLRKYSRGGMLKSIASISSDPDTNFSQNINSTDLKDFEILWKT